MSHRIKITITRHDTSPRKRGKMVNVVTRQKIYQATSQDREPAKRLSLQL